MDARLVPVNAFIAMTSSPSTSWPNPLYELGYRLEALEVPHGPQDRRVVIDCLAFDAAGNHFLAAEAKSGKNVEASQAERYGELDPVELVRMTGVTLTTAGAQSVQPVYICLDENVDRILLALAEAGCDYPVLAVSDSMVTLHNSAAASPTLAERFADPVAVPGPPPAIIRLDEDSSDEEYDRVVSAALVAEAAQPKDVISENELASRALPFLHLYGSGSRTRMVKKVVASARRICDALPDAFEFKGRTATRAYAVVRVVDNPERADPRGRTQRFQALSARLDGLEPRAVIEVPTLFDEIDLAEELEKADTDEPDDGVAGGREGDR